MDAVSPRAPSGLARYVVAATLVRTTDAGAVVGLILLAIDPGHRDAAGPAVGGLLAAALTAPHLLGPWVAARLDRAADGRALLAGSYLLYAIALVAGALALGRTPVAVPIIAVAVAGACGPLLTGGLSSRLAGIAGPGERQQRRAQGWDAVTYGVGGTAGPAVVAGLSAVAGALPALLALGAAAVVAAGLTLTLPRRSAVGGSELDPDAAITGVRAGLALMWTSRPLRQVTTMTLLASLGMGALPLAAVVLGTGLAGRSDAGAALTVGAGVGSLAGSAAVTVFPLRGEPDRLARWLFAALAAVTAACALAPAYGLALAGFVLIGVANATSFTATLAARSAYSPPSARAQVFVTSAGLKVATSSAGAAVAGALVGAGLGGAGLLAAAAGATALGVLVAAGDALADRRP